MIAQNEKMEGNAEIKMLLVPIMKWNSSRALSDRGTGKQHKWIWVKKEDYWHTGNIKFMIKNL